MPNQNNNERTNKEQDLEIDRLNSTIDQLKDKLQEKSTEDEKIISSDKITLGFLFSRLKISHLWGFIVLIASLLSGTSVVTYQFANKKSDAQLISENLKFETELASKNNEIDDLKRRLKVLNALNTKEKFLSQYLIYNFSKKDCSEVDWNENSDSCKDYSREFETMAGVLRKLKEKKTNAETDNMDDCVIIGKSGGIKGVTVKFLYDGSIWMVPEEFSYIIDEK